MGGTIFERGRKKFMDTACPTRGSWFGKFMRGSKLWMGVIKKQEFGVNSNMIKALFMVWDTEWKREAMSHRIYTSCFTEAVVIGFCGGLWG